MGENNRKISLLDRLLEQAQATATYSVDYDEGRDAYDPRGRTTREAALYVQCAVNNEPHLTFWGQS